MQVNSFDEAINVTVRKYNYNEKQIKHIYEELEKGNFLAITSDFGARDFVKKYYTKLGEKYVTNKEESFPFKDFTTLTKYFDRLLEKKGITKENPETLKFLCYNVLTNLKNDKNHNDVEKLLIEAAQLYSRQEMENKKSLRAYNFNTLDITRQEAADLANIFGSMEHQKEKVRNAINFYPGYQRALIQNLIEYSYYEHDFSKSLDEQIEACKSRGI